VLATELETAARSEGMLLPGRAWVDRAWRQAERVAAALRRQGFITRVHFLERFLQRVQELGIRFDPATFGHRFERARHYRQTRPGYTNRVAVVGGLPVVYRMGGPRGRHVVLVSLLPAGQLPPGLAPAPAPGRLPAREAEVGSAFDDPGVRAVCERARTLARAVRQARRPPLQPNRYVLRREALNWLTATARHWARPSWPGRPGQLTRASAADIDRLVTCLVGLERAIQPQPLADVTRLRVAASNELRRRGRWA
jgi:hypothetical protein